jgi:AcrR family transcriptional regulator
VPVTSHEVLEQRSHLTMPPRPVADERVDRRHRRRARTIEQIVDVAVQLIADEGAAGLSLGEVARRMDMRTPSLYGYFPSKNAVYDAVFARGWTELLARLAPAASALDDTDLASCLTRLGSEFVRWAVAHVGYTQLMLWRPVPGYEPSDEAYGPAIEALTRARDVFVQLQHRGLVRPDADLDELVRLWSTITTGIVTQHIANQPGVPFDDGMFTPLVPVAATVVAARYGSPRPRQNTRRPR